MEAGGLACHKTWFSSPVLMTCLYQVRTIAVVTIVFVVNSGVSGVSDDPLWIIFFDSFLGFRNFVITFISAILETYKIKYRGKSKLPYLQTIKTNTLMTKISIKFIFAKNKDTELTKQNLLFNA